MTYSRLTRSAPARAWLIVLISWVIPGGYAQQTRGSGATSTYTEDYISNFTWQPGGTREEEMWQVLVLFGATDRESTSWNGSLGVSAGETLGLSGYRFEPPDRILPEGGWRIDTQDVRILTGSTLAGHGRRSTENAILPKGLLIRGKGSSATKVSVETAQGKFSFSPMALEFGAWDKHMRGRALVQRILEFWLGDHFMGEDFAAAEQQRIRVKVQGTNDIAAIHLIRDANYIYKVSPGKREAEFEYVDNTAGAGEITGITSASNRPTANWPGRVRFGCGTGETDV